MKILFSIYLVLYTLMAVAQKSDPLIKSKELINNEDYDDALEILNTSFANGDTSTEIYLQRGECYMRTSDFEKALKDINYVMQRDSANARAWYLRGFVWGKSDQNELAIKSFTRSIAI